MEQGAALLQWPGKRQPAEQRPTAAARLPACLLPCLLRTDCLGMPLCCFGVGQHLLQVGVIKIVMQAALPRRYEGRRLLAAAPRPSASSPLAATPSAPRRSARRCRRQGTRLRLRCWRPCSAGTRCTAS